jgi:hypothetical protein
MSSSLTASVAVRGGVSKAEVAEHLAQLIDDGRFLQRFRSRCIVGRKDSFPPRVSPSCAREETPESRGMPCLFLNTERGFGGKPPKKSGFRRHLAGSKMLKETFFTAISLCRVLHSRAILQSAARSALVVDRSL